MAYWVSFEQLNNECLAAHFVSGRWFFWSYELWPHVCERQHKRVRTQDYYWATTRAKAGFGPKSIVGLWLMCLTRLQARDGLQNSPPYYFILDFMPYDSRLSYMFLIVFLSEFMPYDL